MELLRPRNNRRDKWFRKWELWEDDQKYLTRWHIWPFKPSDPADQGDEENQKKSAFKIFLHRMDGPDLDRFPHDHPWPFRSLILRGGYTDEQTVGMYEESTNELVYAPGKLVKHRWFQKLPATGVWHRILTIDRQPTWTLVFTGKHRRRWGYLTDGGWIGHD